MDHPRKIIRQTFVEMIKAGGTVAGQRVFDSRDLPLNKGSTPAIVVYSQDETLQDMEQQDHGLRRRVMTLAVECYHIGDNGAGAVDDMAWQIENIIHADPVLIGKVEWCRLISCTMAFADDGEQVLHAALMSFEVIYCTHLYEEDGEPPRTVLVGFDPETGRAHEEKYIRRDHLMRISL